MAQQFDSWQRGITRVSFRALAAFCLTVAILQTRSLFAAAGDYTPSVAVTAVEIVVLVASSVRGWRGRLDHKDALVFTAVLAVAAATPSPMQDPASTGGDGNPAFFFLATTMLLYIVVLRGVAVLAAIAGATGVYIASTVVAGDRMLGPAVDEAILLASSQVAIWLVFRLLAQEALRADHAHDRAIAEQGLAARGAAEQRTTLAARRTLHDRVLTALLLVSQGATGRGTAVVDECRRAAAAVATLRVSSTSAAGITDEELHRRIRTEAEAAAETTGVAARVRHRPARQALPIPGPVGEAMSAAVAEALRNVGRHAGVRDAEVLLTAAADGGVRVEVIDRGRGLPPGSAAGFGLRHSVSTRLREIGGTARVDSSPERGTHVTLHWEPASTEQPVATPLGRSGGEPELTRISSHPLAFAFVFSATLLAGASYLAVRYPFPRTSGWADLAVLSVVVAYVAVCIVAIPSPLALRRAHQAGFVILPGLLAAGLYLGGPGSLQGFDCWVVGLMGTPVLLLAMARPAVPVLALALLESGVVAVAAVVDPVVSPLEVLAPITQTPMFTLLMVWGVSAVRRVRRTAELDEDAAAAAVAMTQAVEARRRAMETHLTWLDGDVRPFLDGVAGAELTPTDPAVQQRAAILALAVRDELALPAQLSADLRDLIAEARRRGTRVRVRAGDDGAPATAQEELEKILGLLATRSELTEITVSLPQAASPFLRVVVRPRLAPTQASAALALLGEELAEIDEDELATIITLKPVTLERA